LGGRVPLRWSGARAGLIGWPEPELALLELARASEARTSRLPKQGRSPRSRGLEDKFTRQLKLRTAREEAAASGATLTTALICAARSRAATSCLKKREETFIAFRRELISPDSAFVGQGNFFRPPRGGGRGFFWPVSAGSSGWFRLGPADY
jgi:hypothetical protein